MTPSPRLWIATFVALVFLIGATAGVVVDRAWLLPGRGFDRGGLMMGGGAGRGAGPGARAGGPGFQSPDLVVADLDEQIKLSDSQKTEILRILESWRPRIQELQNTTRQQFIDMQQQLRAEIGRTLTTEQLAAFERLRPGPLEGGRGPRGDGAGRGPRGRGR